jgi:hypothetical protein
MFSANFSWAIERSFWFSGKFPTMVTTDNKLDGRRQNLPFSCFLPFFVGYSALLLVVGIISSDHDPQ